VTKSIKLLVGLFLSLIFQITGMAAALAAPESDWSHFYKDGEHALFIGDYPTAQRAFGSALELLKRSGDHSARLKFTLEKLTQSFLLDNNLKSAELTYIQLRELLPNGDRSTKLEQVFMIDLKELANAYERKWNRYHDPKTLEHSIELFEVASNGADPKISEDMLTLARVYIEHGEVNRGIELLRRACSISEKRFGKNPDALSETLYRFAIDLQSRAKYDQARACVLYIIENASKRQGSSSNGLPAFYLLLGMNAIAQGKPSEGKRDFDRAIEEGAKIKGDANKKCAKQYFLALEQPIWSDKREDKLTLAESKFTELMAVEHSTFNGPLDSYGILAPLVDAQNKLAIKCETEQKYDQTKELELAVIKSMRRDPEAATIRLPAFYFLLGMNATARGKPTESTAYYNQCMSESSKVKSAERLAEEFLDLLIDPIWSDTARGDLPLAESRLKLLEAAEGKISKDPIYQFQALSRLAALLCFQGKDEQSCKYVKRCITIALLPKSKWRSELPDLYLRLGIYQADLRTMGEADKSFAEALKVEASKNGPHSVLVLLRWGRSSIQNQKYASAKEKLEAALSIARKQSPQDRKASAADALEMLSSIADVYGRHADAVSLLRERMTEIESQKKFGFKFGSITDRLGK
jgi:tetratricopeptide (TPR) repeat protein